MGHDRQASYRQVLARGHGARLRVGVRPSALPVLPTAHSPRPRRADCLVGVVTARRQCRVVCGIWASWGGKRTDHVQPVRIMRIHSTCKCTPGLTAWCVIYRRAACQLRDQMCSPDDHLSVRSGPAFAIATCGKLRAKEDQVQCGVSGSVRVRVIMWSMLMSAAVSFMYKMAPLTLQITSFTAGRANEIRIFISKGEARAAKNTENKEKK